MILKSISFLVGKLRREILDFYQIFKYVSQLIRFRSLQIEREQVEEILAWRDLDHYL